MHAACSFVHKENRMVSIWQFTKTIIFFLCELTYYYQLHNKLQKQKQKKERQTSEATWNDYQNHTAPHSAQIILSAKQSNASSTHAFEIPEQLSKSESHRMIVFFQSFWFSFNFLNNGFARSLAIFCVRCCCCCCCHWSPIQSQPYIHYARGRSNESISFVCVCVLGQRNVERMSKYVVQLSAIFISIFYLIT